MSHKSVSTSQGEFADKAVGAETVRSHSFKGVSKGLTVGR